MSFILEAGAYLVSHPYLHAVSIFAFAMLIAEFLLFFFKHVVEKIVQKTKTRLDNKIVFRVEHPLVILVVLVGLLLAIRKIVFSLYFFENFIVTIIVFVVAYVFSGIANILIIYWQKSRVNWESSSEFHDEVLPLISSLIRIVISIIALIVILQIWGVEVGTLIASIGIVGVILGFAFQDTMKNIFGGIALISDNSIKKHDVIKLESGEIGEIVEMSLRSTQIKTLDGDFLLVPNGILANTRFTNYALPTTTMRLTVPVGVVYGSDPNFVKQVLLSVLKGRNDVLTLPRREVRFVKMNDFSMDFELLFYISDYHERYIIADAITTEVYLALDRNGIAIPFPTRTIYSEKKRSRNKLNSSKEIILPPSFVELKKTVSKKTKPVKKSSSKVTTEKFVKKSTRKTVKKVTKNRK